MSLEFGRTKASVMLDLVRGVAALLVCVGHWRNIFFLDFGQLKLHRLATAGFYFLSSLEHEAVIVFFVLSGYLISGSVLRAVRREEWSWRQYATHRLVRLWIVLLPGLALCALWDGVGLRSGLAPLLYHGASGNHLVYDVSELRGWRVLLGNVAFLQGIRVPTFGSDGPLWSLANEFSYYVLFPLGLLAMMPKYRVWLRVGLAAAFLLVAWFVGMPVLLYFPVWLAGVVLGLLRVRELQSWVRWVCMGVYLVFVAAMTKLGVAIGRPTTATMYVADYAVMAATVAMLWVLLSAREPSGGEIWERISRGLARFSFTLYVSHLPALVLLRALTGGDVRWMPDGRHMVAAIGALVVVLGYCWGVAWMTEFRTGLVRGWVERKLRVDRQGRDRGKRRVERVPAPVGSRNRLDGV